jgi:hypothetical protein
MREWIRFGEQVNQLVYTLAGAKFMGDIETANRFVAEHIHYSESSVRMMRQGRFRPQNDQSLATMVQLGKQKAGLEYQWGRTLLISGQHPDPEKILQKVYNNAPESLPSTSIKTAVSPSTFFTSRSTAAFAGTLLLLGMWTFGISPGYPPPHEPSLFMEIIWGITVGLGLAAGLAGIDTYRSRKFSEDLWRYLLLPVGGLFGAGCWRFGNAQLLSANNGAMIESNPIESFAFGLCYATGLTIVIAGLISYERKNLPGRFHWLTFTGMILFGGLSALAGFLLPYIHPAFSNQRDIDLVVGLALRLGLAIIAGIGFPPLSLPEFHESGKVKWIPWHT